MSLLLAVSGLVAGCGAPTIPDGVLVIGEAGSAKKRRCVECGWIESSRAISGAADNRTVRTVEYTIRMGDGTSRVFNGDSGEHWRLGERLKVIEGAR